MKFLAGLIMAIFLLTGVDTVNAQQGGTLHHSTLSTWVKSDRKNKLATASNIAKSLGLSTNKAKLREWAIEIVSCIDEVAFEPALRQMRVNESAVICVQMLKEDGMR